MHIIITGIRQDYKYDATASTKRASSLFSFYFPPGFLRNPRRFQKVGENIKVRTLVDQPMKQEIRRKKKS